MGYFYCIKNRVCLSFNKKLRCRLKKPSARRKTQLIAGLFTSFTTTTMAFLGTTRRGGLLFCPLCVKKTLFRMTKRQFFCLDWAKNKLRRSLLLKDKQTLKTNRTFPLFFPKNLLFYAIIRSIFSSQN